MTQAEYIANVRARFGAVPLHVLENAAMKRRTSPTLNASGGKTEERLEAERSATRAVILMALATPCTVNDICAKTGMCYDRVLHHLNALNRAEKVTCDKSRRPTIWGRNTA